MKNIGILVFTFFLSAYMFFSIGHFGGDGYQDYLTAESIVLDGNLSLKDRPQDVDEIKYDTKVGRPGKDGKYYSTRPVIGLPILISPFYAVGHFIAGFMKDVPHDHVTMLVVSFFNPFFSALNALLIFGVARRMGFARGVSFILSVVYGFATMAPVYARTGFSEPAAMFFMLLSLYGLLAYKEKTTYGSLLLASLALAGMLLCRIQAIIVVPAFAVYFFWILYDEKGNPSGKILKAVIFVGIVSMALGSVILMNNALFGGAFSFGGSDSGEVGKRIMTADHFLKGLYYYVLSPGKGFLFFNVPLILILFSLDKSFAGRKKETVFFLLVFVLLLIFYSKSFRRGSLFNWGPRYLIFAVPLLVLLLGDFLRKFDHWRGKLVLFIISAAGFLIAAPCMFINQSRFYKFVVEKLKLDEYMINFIPDLSPIKGAWCLFFSWIKSISGGDTLNFIYEPDYWLVEKISIPLAGYDAPDIWFIKVMEMAPGMHNAVYAALGVLSIVFAVSLIRIIVVLKEERSSNGC